MTYGALLLLISAPAVVPGLGSVAAPLTGAAAVLLGWQLATGRPAPWLPSGWQQRLEGVGLLRRVEAAVHGFALRWVPDGGVVLPRWLLGLGVAWAGLLLMLPLALIPFSNTVPALALASFGAALHSTRAWLGWIGLALSGGFTALLALLGFALASALG